MECGLIRKKMPFSEVSEFLILSYIYPKSKTLTSRNFILITFLVVYKTQKYDLEEKTLISQCGLRRKNVHFRGFRFCPILEMENLETSESFPLLQFFITLVALSMGKIKTFN